jgi:peptidoglycan/LPS O-acetylase OafA/YrhL
MPTIQASSLPPHGKRRFYVPSLDGVRTVAFTFVFLSHAGLGRVVPGGFGVTVFLFLSGYLVTSLLRLEVERKGTVDLKRFYLRRALRILPPLYLVVASTTLLTVTGVLRGTARPLSVLAHLAFLSNYDRVFWTGVENQLPGTGVLWAVALEVHFYLVFPLVYLLMRRCASARGQMFALLALCGAALAWRLALVFGFGEGGDRIFYCSDTRFDAILFGCALAVYANPSLDPRERSAWLTRPRVLAAAAIVIAATLLYRDEWFRETVRHTLQSAALAPWIVAAIRYHDSPWFRWLNYGWVRRAGVLTYTLYLVHYVVLDGTRPHVGDYPALHGAVALAISLLLAVSMHFLVERPCNALRRRLAPA